MEQNSNLNKTEVVEAVRVDLPQEIVNTINRNRAVRNVDKHLTSSFIMEIDGSSVKAEKYANKLLQEGWDIEIVSQKRGRCYFHSRLILLPDWAYKRSASYFNYYLAHELAHAKSILDHGIQVNSHGKEFMAAFKLLCESANWHHELNYKPKNAAKAGIMLIPEDF